ncbi:MAG: polysaccharide deacetylase family protein [Pseudomonadota bacterium]
MTAGLKRISGVWTVRTVTLLFLFLGLFLALLFAVWQLSKAPSFQLFGDVVARVTTDQPYVALTFDDGPSKRYTLEVLNTLKVHNVKATFYVTGREAEQNPTHMKAIVVAGHDLGNHSYSHHRMVFMSPGRVRRELARTDAQIRKAGYAGAIRFRPPYGTRLITLPWVLKKQNRLTVMWDVAPDADHRLPTKTIVDAALQGASAGSIILLHPMYASRQNTRDALGAIIEGLRKRGLEPVTVSKLLAARTER